MNVQFLSQKKVGLTMLLFCLLIFQAQILQASPPTKDVEEVLLVEAIQKISRKYQVLFSYDREWVKDITVKYDEAATNDLEEALSSIISQTNLKYQIFDQRYVAVYRDTDEGLVSLQKMISHFQGIVDQKQAIRKRQVKSLTPISTYTTKEIYNKRVVINISGKVVNRSGEPLIGVNVLIKGTGKGSATDFNGNFTIEDVDENAVLVISYIGYQTLEISLDGRTNYNITLLEDSQTLDEVVVIGYGTQKKSDITGSVTSLNEGRLDMVPNLNIAQAIQGSLPGVSVQQSGGGANPTEEIMVRGRNSIKASNSPLIVLDGVPYSGTLSSINAKDVASIEVLKDASATAIYGSRGANGVILITSKKGNIGAPVIEVDAKYGIQDYVNLPRLMTGEEFYLYKQERDPLAIKAGETEIYESGEWTDWLDLAFRKGQSQMYNVSATGGSEYTTYYISGNLTDVKGITVGDQLQRISGRVNIETKITDWLTIGSRSQLTHEDRSGIPPGWGKSYGSLYGMNPLTKAYDENGELNRFPAYWDPGLSNPLIGQLWDNSDYSLQIVSNNFARVDFPFIEGLSYTLNTGIRRNNTDISTYKDRRSTDTGYGETFNGIENSLLVDNIFSYNKSIGRNSISLTGLLSYEKNNSSSVQVIGSNYPHDFLTIYSIGQALSITNNYDYSRQALISQMLRLNYSFDGKYLVTGTIRRDGYSGFGENNKWGVFPSFALGYNLAKESFFPWKDLFNEFKIRTSFGLNGNQAVSPYSTLTSLASMDYVNGSDNLAGYVPGTLGQDELGWESSRTFNFGLDFSMLQGRISGDINAYHTNTRDLLLDRSISLVHGITSITQNIGETENQGIEFGFTTNNITSKKFSWTTIGNLSFTKNKIVSLYGIIGDGDSEIDDLSNRWFIGHPIRVAHGYQHVGTWQLDEADEAAKYGSEPGWVKLLDVNGDGKMTVEDQTIQGQLDPKFLWGMTNSFNFMDFQLDVFLHGVHGVTKESQRLYENGSNETRLSGTHKPYWTPENPTNDWIANHLLADQMAGAGLRLFEKADFIRVKDITFSYDGLNELLGLDQLRLYFTGRNLFTITDWHNLDPELNDEYEFPLQKEFVFGLTIKF